MSHAFALSGTNLISFDTATPTTTAIIPITALTAGETLVGIDFRPQNGLLYGLGVNAATNTATLYVISTRTGFATAVGTPGQVAFEDGGGNPIDFPDPATVGWGFDFNPAVDRIRVTAGSLNFRVNPNNGAPVDSDANAGNGTNPDTPINGGTTTIDGSAYTNNQPNNGAVTTLYSLDAASNMLFIQNPANNGTQTLGQVVTLNGNPLDFTSVNAFDVPAGVNAPASNAPVTTGSAFAVLNVGGTTGLYSINLVNAQATFVGPVSNGAMGVQGLAIQNDYGGIPAIALTADGTFLVRFNTATPGTTTALPLGAPTAGETVVAIDFRPQTGQLYAFGVNATANTGTLYLVDPQTGFLTVVGAPSGIAFAGEDFPDPATSGYGMDFNPAADRIRITTDTGLNFRLNPNNGAPVAATTDTDINGSGSTGVSATAYTNSYAHSPGGVTTLYTLDAASDMLFIQNPANSGTQTSGLAVTLGGSPLDFTGVNGFDIPAGVIVTTSNAPATGFGYAGLTVAGVTSLYQIDLATGAAINLGALPTGLAGLTLADAQFAPAITSNGAGTTAGISIAENSTAVTTVTAFDGNFDAVTFAIVGGADAAKFQINAGTGALSFLAAPNFEAPTDADTNNSYVVQVRASDGSLFDTQTITVSVTDVLEPINLTPGDDNFTAPAGNALVNGLGGVDTITFGFALTDATVTYAGNTVVIDSASSHTVLTGFEKFVFTDGTVNNNDGNVLVDDLFYFSQYHDVWSVGLDAELHYNTVGWHEGRDPDAFFSTLIYLSANPDVNAAGVNPLEHFHASGWQEGRVPSLKFDPAAYLAANPDVAAAHVDPLAHFLEFGAQEGRQPAAPTALVTAGGFDYVFYLQNNPDVAAAHVDPLQHFQAIGWQEGRNPNALFDTAGYLATYADVAAAHINPLDHYNGAGWHEGRDPSVGFDTTAYLAAYTDVAAAHINPLTHFLQFGQQEGRSAFADGTWG